MLTRNQIEELLINDPNFDYDPRDEQTDDETDEETEVYFAGYDPTDPLWITDAELEARIDRDAELRQIVRDISEPRWKREQELQIAELEAQLKDAPDIFPVLDHLDSIRKNGPEVDGTCDMTWDLHAFGPHGTLCKDLPYITTELMRAKSDLGACIDALAEATGYDSAEALLRGRKLGDAHYQFRDASSCIENAIGRVQRIARALDNDTLPAGNSYFGLTRDDAVDIRNRFFIPSRRGVYRAIDRLELADEVVEARCMEATADLRNAREHLHAAGRVLSAIENLMKGETKVMVHHGWIDFEQAA